MSDRSPRTPAGLKAAGSALWKRMHEAYSFAESPESLFTLEQACRTADVIAKLQAAVDADDDLTTRGSQGQRVASPHLTELRQYRNLLNTLLKSLNCPSEDGEFLASGKMSRSASGKVAAAARWSRRAGA